jgi:hypothetical protein
MNNRRDFITLLGGAVAYCAKQASDAGGINPRVSGDRCGDAVG